MITEQLKDKGLTDMNKVIDYLSLNHRGLYCLPENVADLIVALAKHNSPNSCLNLNSNIGEVLSKCGEIGNCMGVEANAENVEIAKYLNPELSIENTNPLEFKTGGKYDAVICFPPLGQRITVSGRRFQSERLYVSKSLELLKDGGTVILIMPNSFLSAPVYNDLRNLILNHHGLTKIISLPRGIIGQTSIGLSVIQIGKPQNDETNFFKIESRSFNAVEVLGVKPSFKVNKENLTERWDYNFHNPTNRVYEQQLESHETKKLGSLVEVYLGVPFSRDEFELEGEYLWLTNRNISKGELKFSDSDKYITKKALNRREQNAVLQNGDILIPRIHKAKEPYYVHSESKQRLIAFQHFIILRGKNAEYVAMYLNTENGTNLFNQQLKRHARGSVVPVISVSDLRNIEIPILPIQDLELASKRKLQKLSYEELLEINEKYISLQADFQRLKAKQTVSPHEEQLSSMRSILNEVLSKQEETLSNQKELASKLDLISSALVELSNEFQQVKALPRDIEEKINRLHSNLDGKLARLLNDQKELDTYIEEIKRWFEYYDVLEFQSQKYLPEAEYIFDHISKLENPDYSPFILQYCRALENELLKKIFRAYVQSLLDREVNMEESFAWDFGRKESGKANNENTFRLAKHLQRCIATEEKKWFFELGSMEVNLRYLTGNSLNKSPLLQDLKTFILSKFKSELLNVEYLNEIKTIIIEYRNQSAHPNLIDTDKAVKFHKEMKRCLIHLMENYRQANQTV